MSALAGIGKVLLAMLGSTVLIAVFLLLFSLIDLRDYDDLLLLAGVALLLWIGSFVFLLRILFRKPRTAL